MLLAGMEKQFHRISRSKSETSSSSLPRKNKQAGRLEDATLIPPLPVPEEASDLSTINVPH